MRSGRINQARLRSASERWQENLYRAKLAYRTARVLSPPRPSEFGAFGDRSVVVPPCRVSTPECIFIGDDVVILEHAWLSVVRAFDDITPHLDIRNGTRIGRFSSIGCVGSITIHENVLTADFLFVGDSYHRYDILEQPVVDQPMTQPKPVEIGPGSFLGIRATVLAGVTIGEHAYVGAGSVVTKDVPDYAIVAGNPAEIVRFQR